MRAPAWIARPRSLRQGLALLAACGLVVVLASGCGVPVDSAAHALPAAQFVPTPTNPNHPKTPPARPGSENGYSVFFLQRGVLTPVTRSDPSASAPVTPPIAIASLDDGPNAHELVAGYESALSEAPGAQVSVVGVTAGTITVALNSNFVNLLLGQNLPEAYGQIVLTLTSPAFPYIKEVQFIYDDSPLAALLPNGGIATTVVLCDYASIATRAIKARCANQ